MVTIVYIEDEEDIRRDVAEELRDSDYNVIEAGNGIDGLKAITQHRPDLVLCDISMPGMSGLELLTKLRAGEESYNDLPFIFLTALADRADIITGKKSGADDYLTKPIDLEILLATIETHLRRLKCIEEKRDQQLVKLYRAITDEQGAVVSEETEVQETGLEITIVADDTFGSDGVVSLLEAQGHKVQRMKSGRKFLDALEGGMSPSLVLMTLYTVDLAAPLLVKLAKDTYQTPFPILLLVPTGMYDRVGDDQLNLFDGHIEFPCAAEKFVAEIQKLLPQAK